MAQVYPRIQNPYMPQGTPDKTNAPTPVYAPGEIGSAFNDQSTGGSYLRVLVDSGATAATAVGVIAAGQLAYWKNRAANLVTNDKAQCDVGPTGAVNRIAGIFQLAVTTAPGVNGTDGNPLQYMTDLVIQKKAYPIGITGSAPSVAGVAAIADTGSTALAKAVVNATTAPGSQLLGYFTSVTVTSNTCPCDVNIGFVD